VNPAHVPAPVLHIPLPALFRCDSGGRWRAGTPLPPEPNGAADLRLPRGRSSAEQEVSIVTSPKPSSFPAFIEGEIQRAEAVGSYVDQALYARYVLEVYERLHPEESARGRELSTREAARLEGVSPRTITLRCNLGEYPGAYRSAAGSGPWRVPARSLVDRRERQLEQAPAQERAPNESDPGSGPGPNAPRGPGALPPHTPTEPERPTEDVPDYRKLL